MIKITRPMSEPEYRAVDCLSYSMLSGLSKSPGNLISKEKPEGAGLTFGSAVDTLAFDGETEFFKKFAIMATKQPTYKIKQVIDDIIKSQSNEIFYKEYDELEPTILITARSLEYGADNWKDETILRKIKEEGGKDYYDFFKSNADKMIIDPVIYENVINSVTALYNHPFTSKWFNADEENGWQLIFQYPLFGKVKFNDVETKVKGLMDILAIDHVNKIIYPVDLKTSAGHVLDFKTAFVKWNYYIQASLYFLLIKQWAIENGLVDYNIANFKFIIISSTDFFHRPLVYNCTTNDLYCGEHGGTIQGESVKGYRQLIQEYYWHTINEKYDYPKEIYDNKGELSLNIFD